VKPNFNGFQRGSFPVGRTRTGEPQHFSLDPPPRHDPLQFGNKGLMTRIPPQTQPTTCGQVSLHVRHFGTIARNCENHRDPCA
jgi:hypothetical protein